MNPMQLVLALGTWGQHHRWHLFYAMGALCLLALVAEVVGRRRRAETTTHGSARWATVREVKRAGLTARHGVVVGRLDGRLLRDDGFGTGPRPRALSLGAERRGRYGAWVILRDEAISAAYGISAAMGWVSRKFKNNRAGSDKTRLRS